MYITTKGVIAGVALTALMGLHAHAQNQRAVSIVFTDMDRINTVDTIISSDAKSLDQLLGAFDLGQDDVHTIFMNSKANSWVEKEGQQQRVMVFETVEEVDGEERKVEVIKVSGDNMKDLSEEERALIEQELETARQRHAKGKEEMIIERKVVIKKEREEKGESSEDEKEVRIEVTMDNGKEVVVGYVNGEPLSEEEARKMLDEERSNMKDNPEMEVERKMVFISEDEEVQGNDVRIKRREYKSTDLGDMKAIVIVKELEGDKKVGYNPMNVGSLHLYPNPAKQSVQANFEGVKGAYSLVISNLAGQTIWSEDGSAQGMLQKEVDLKGFAPGTYIISLSHDQGLNSQKLVVE